MGIVVRGDGARGVGAGRPLWQFRFAAGESRGTGSDDRGMDAGPGTPCDGAQAAGVGNRGTYGAEHVRFVQRSATGPSGTFRAGAASDDGHNIRRELALQTLAHAGASRTRGADARSA